MKTIIVRYIFYFIFLCITIFSLSAAAQETDVQRALFEMEDVISTYSDRDVDVEDQLERLYFQKNKDFQPPFSINNITKAELIWLNLLNDNQIASFLKFREQIGSFTSIYGIQAVPLWDSLTISRLIPFLILNKNNLTLPNKNEPWIFKDRWESVIRLTPLKEKKGADWLGSNQYVGINFRYSPIDRIKMGISMEKDPGETLFYRGKPDYLSWFLSFGSKIKGGPEVFLGDYKTSWGQGLLNASYGTFKNIQTTDISRSPLQIHSHKSFAENGYYRGMILSYPIHKNVTWIPMISLRNRDATFTQDSFPFITQLLLSGYHRTQNEKKSKGYAQILHIGNRIQWQGEAITLGLNAIYQLMKPGQRKPDELYNQFYYSGENYTGASVDYHFNLSNWHVSGEIAYANAVATIFQLQHPMDKKLDVAILGRYYPKKYQGILAQAWGENSVNRNEQGMYLGLVYQISQEWKCSIYHDIYMHPWVRYQINSSTKGTEQRGRLAYDKKKSIKFYVEWLTKKEEETNFDTPGVHFYVRNQYRTHLEIPGKSILWRLRFDLGNNYFEEKKQSGYAMWVEAWYKQISRTWTLSARIGLHHTPDYGVRFYHFEQQVTGVYGLKPYYGKGGFINLVGKINLGKTLKWEIMVRRKWGLERGTTLTNQFKLG
jgi:hypothetical protein